MLIGRRIGAGGACFVSGLVWMAGMAASSPAGATTLRRMDLPELVSSSDRVVHARAVDKKVYWDETGTRIYTDTTFEVLEEAKGQGPKRLTVIMLGGRIDPAEMTVEGTPVFRVGEEVVLFTSPRPDGKKNLVGFSQGVMRVHEDPATGEKLAASSVPLGIRFVEGAQGRPSAARPSRMRAPLAALLEQVRQMATGVGPAGPTLSKTPVRLDTKRKSDGRP